MIRAYLIGAALLAVSLPALAQTRLPCGGQAMPPVGGPMACATSGSAPNLLPGKTIITTNEHASSTLKAPRSVHAGGGWDPTSIKSPRDAASGLVEDEWYGYPTTATPKPAQNKVRSDLQKKLETTTEGVLQKF
jgi:hypothetical protein